MLSICLPYRYVAFVSDSSEAWRVGGVGLGGAPGPNPSTNASTPPETLDPWIPGSRRGSGVQGLRAFGVPNALVLH